MMEMKTSTITITMAGTRREEQNERSIAGSDGGRTGWFSGCECFPEWTDYLEFGQRGHAGIPHTRHQLSTGTGSLGRRFELCRIFSGGTPGAKPAPAARR